MYNTLFKKCNPGLFVNNTQFTLHITAKIFNPNQITVWHKAMHSGNVEGNQPCFLNFLTNKNQKSEAKKPQQKQQKNIYEKCYLKDK